MVRLEPLKVLPAEVTDEDHAALAEYIASMPAGYAVPGWASEPVELVALSGDDPGSEYPIRMICDAFPPAEYGYMFVFCAPRLVARMLTWYHQNVGAAVEVPDRFQALLARSGALALPAIAAAIEDPDDLDQAACELWVQLDELLAASPPADIDAVLRVSAEFEAPPGMSLGDVIGAAKLIAADRPT